MSTVNLSVGPKPSEFEGIPGCLMLGPRCVLVVNEVDARAEQALLAEDGTVEDLPPSTPELLCLGYVMGLPRRRVTLPLGSVLCPASTQYVRLFFVLPTGKLLIMEAASKDEPIVLRPWSW